MPHFSLPDTSGLTPLEFPFGTSNPFRSFVTNLPQPAPEAVAHFQGAMAEPQAESDVSSTPKDDSTPITDVGRVNFIYDMPYTSLQEVAPDQPDAEITIERQDIGQTTDDRQVRQTTIDMPTQVQATDVPMQLHTTDISTLVQATDSPKQVQAIDMPVQAQTVTQPNPLPVIDDSTVRRQDVIDGTVRIVTTKVERVDTQPTVAARPEAAPYQADAEITIERQNIVQTTADKKVWQTVDDKQVLQAVNDMPPTLQAAPVVVPVAPDIAPTAVADIVSIEIDPAAATAKTRELVEAAAQVADTILVTPSLVRGDGEITIRLKPTVLDGSEIRMKAKGTEIAIIIAPATPSVAQIVEQAKVQFEQMLAERLPTFQIAVSIQPAKTTSKWKDSAA